VRLWLAIILSALCGYLALSYELLWFRVYLIAKGALGSCFALLLGTYLLALAAGAWLSRRFCRERVSADAPKYFRLIANFLFVAYVLAFLSIPLYSWYCVASYRESRIPWMALAAGFIGVAFPLIAHASISVDSNAGPRLSYLYLANIVGSAAGSLLTGFCLMDLWPLQHLSLFLLLLGLAIVSALLARGGFTRRQLAIRLSLLTAIGAGASLITPRLFNGFYERLQLGPEYTSNYHFAHVLENRNSVITITPDKVVHGGGTYDGAVNIDPKRPDINQIFRAYAVSALHAEPRQVLMIGLSLGSWAQVIAHHPAVEKLTVVELNPGYLDLIRKYPEVASLLQNPKIEIVIDDGRRWLNRHPDRKFDLIVFNTMAHWIASSAHVLSREFFELVRAHLAPGGVYYYNSTSSSRSLKTAATVFTDVRLIASFVAASDRRISFDLDRFREILTNYRIDGRRLFDPSNTEHRAELDRIVRALTYQDVPREKILSRTPALALITDDNMGYEWDDAL